MNNFLKSVSGTTFCKTPAQRILRSGLLVYHVANFSRDAGIPSIATLSDGSTPGKNSLRRKVDSHGLPCSKKLNHVAVYSFAFYQHLKTLPCFYHFFTGDDVSDGLRHLLTSVFYA